MAKKSTATEVATETKKVFDKTNTCSVNIVTAKQGKNEGKKYSLFICNINGIELTGILNSNQGSLSGILKRNKEQKKSDAVVVIDRVNSANIDAPVYRGTVTTTKGNKFEVALWEQFSSEYHFWSGKVKPEGESVVKADDGSNPFLESFDAGMEVRSNPDKYNQNRSTSFVETDVDDLPF